MFRFVPCVLTLTRWFLKSNIMRNSLSLPIFNEIVKKQYLNISHFHLIKYVDLGP